MNQGGVPRSMFNTVIKKTIALVLIAYCIQVNAKITLGAPAPDAVLPDLSTGSLTRISELKGRVIYLEFWASWCKSCPKAFTMLNQVRDEFSRRDFEVVGINVAEQREVGLNFLKKHPVNFPVLHDDSGKAAESFQLPAMPYGVLLDRQGNVYSTYTGIHESDELDLKEKILKLIGKR